MRADCPLSKSCGPTGHIYREGKWWRCACLEQEVNKQRLGMFAVKNPREDTVLWRYREENLLIEGPLGIIRPHVAGVLNRLLEQGKTFDFMDAYRLVEIFLDKDEEYQTSQDLADYDLFGILLGFGDVLNRRLPDLIVQALARRELKQRPTWVILGLSLKQVPAKYNADVFDKINNYRKVAVRS